MNTQSAPPRSTARPLAQPQPLTKPPVTSNPTTFTFPSSTSNNVPTVMSGQAGSTTNGATIMVPGSSGTQGTAPGPAGISQPKQAPLDSQVTRELLSQCDWIDKTLWVSRQLLGGHAVNGFFRSTASVQRIKKQRQRQVRSRDKNTTTDDASIATGASAEQSKKREAPVNTDQEGEETIKQQVMNARTAKKIKSELEVGLQFCEMLHAVVRDVLQQLDATPPDPLNNDLPIPPKSSSGTFTRQRALPMAAALSSKKKTSSRQASPKPNSALTGPPSDVHAEPASPSPASSGNVQGSTLRKNRKRKLPPNKELVPNLPEIDSSGKRLFSKKESTYRLFECLRYRSLRQGELVAARISSRDLWILARVVQAYPGNDTTPPLEFLQLTEAKREQLFREKVVVQDIEDEKAESIAVQRSLVLPLPRNFSEAADWGSRYKKGFRVYAMYPHTTSLYTATVVDSTTYCRQDDDIIVVEFDGDEPDYSGAIPKCHIPARFVTLMPPSFPGSGEDSKDRKGNVIPTQNNSVASRNWVPPPSDEDFFLGDMDFEGISNLDEFDGLEFDLDL